MQGRRLTYSRTTKIIDIEFMGTLNVVTLTGMWAGAGQPRLNFKVSHGHAWATCPLPLPEAQLLFLRLRSKRTTASCRPTKHPHGPIPLEKKMTSSASDSHQVVLR